MCQGEAEAAGIENPNFQLLLIPAPVSNELRADRGLRGEDTVTCRIELSPGDTSAALLLLLLPP